MLTVLIRRHSQLVGLCVEAPPRNPPSELTLRLMDAGQITADIESHTALARLNGLDTYRSQDFVVTEMLGAVADIQQNEWPPYKGNALRRCELLKGLGKSQAGNSPRTASG